jgi:hypothetical protein
VSVPTASDFTSCQRQQGHDAVKHEAVRMQDRGLQWGGGHGLITGLCWFDCACRPRSACPPSLLLCLKRPYRRPLRSASSDQELSSPACACQWVLSFNALTLLQVHASGTSYSAPPCFRAFCI